MDCICCVSYIVTLLLANVKCMIMIPIKVII